MSKKHIQDLVESGAFASACGAHTPEECLIHVYCSGLRDPQDPGRGHLMQRGMVSADLGLDGVPSPPFTSDEMQLILRAAKMQALKCLRARKSAV